MNLNEDGRPRAWVAESWKVAPDGLSVIVQLRPHAKFHDGTPVTASTLVAILQTSLPRAMGPAYEDVDRISSPNDQQIRIDLHRPSSFVVEALETSIQKPGAVGVGTGPYAAAAAPASGELRANTDYYLGRPTIDRIAVTSYPSVRTAWAELLRGNIDMLYEVNADALDSLQSSTSVSVFSFVRRYQYLVVFSPRVAAFKSAAIRRGLNAAIDRTALVREALNGYGVPSSGPIAAAHWAMRPDLPKVTLDPNLAKTLLPQHLRFTLLVAPDSVYGRVALELKRQLAAVSVDVELKEASQDNIIEAVSHNDFDAALLDTISGPSLFRLYQRWHSGGRFNPRPTSSPIIDDALDRIRHASSDDEYRMGVAAFQKAVVDDPPAIFLAWSQRARAVSRRFDVPVPEDGRDVLSTLRLWRPTPNQQAASRN